MGRTEGEKDSDWVWYPNEATTRVKESNRTTDDI